MIAGLDADRSVARDHFPEPRRPGLGRASRRTGGQSRGEETQRLAAFGPARSSGRRQRARGRTIATPRAPDGRGDDRSRRRAARQDVNVAVRPTFRVRHGCLRVSPAIESQRWHSDAQGAVRFDDRLRPPPRPGARRRATGTVRWASAPTESASCCRCTRADAGTRWSFAATGSDGAADAALLVLATACPASSRERTPSAKRTSRCRERGQSTRSGAAHAGSPLPPRCTMWLARSVEKNRLADREEATIVLVIDVSGAMPAEAVETTRPGAQKVVREFLRGCRIASSRVVGLETAEVAARRRGRSSQSTQSTICTTSAQATRGSPRSRGRARRRAGERVRGSGALLRPRTAEDRGRAAPLEGAARAKSFKIPITARARHAGGCGDFNGLASRGSFPYPHRPTMRQIAA